MILPALERRTKSWAKRVSFEFLVLLFLSLYSLPVSDAGAASDVPTLRLSVSHSTTLPFLDEVSNGRAFRSRERSLDVCPDSTVGSNDSWDSWLFGSGPSELGRFPDVTAMIPYNGDLYVFGNFSHVGGVPADNWARWDGRSWHAVERIGDLESVTDGIVWQGKLILSGFFRWGEGDSTSVLAAWDGQTWSSMGTGVREDRFRLARTIMTYRDGLLIGGWFDDFAGVGSANVAQWDGTKWTGMGAGLPTREFNGVQDLTVYEGELLACGNVAISEGDTAAKIVRWTDGSWEIFAEAQADADDRSTTFRSLAVHDGSLFVAGRIDTIATVATQHIARFDGRWNAIEGISKEVGAPLLRKLESLGNDLLVLGSFDSAGEHTTRSVALWKSGAWFPMGAGLSGRVSASVRCTAEYQNQIFVGGGFDRSGDRWIGSAARWTGSKWIEIGSPGGALPEPARAALTTPDGLVVSYSAEEEEGERGYFLIQTEEGWRTYADPVHGVVADLALYRGRVVSSGRFESADGSAHHIAVWDGVNWQPLGGSPDEGVISLLSHRGDLFIGGVFDEVGGVEGTEGIARWDGLRWHSIEGVSGQVYSIQPDGPGILVAGDYEWAGRLRAPGLARWNERWSVPWGYTFSTDSKTRAAVRWNGGVVSLGPLDLDHSDGRDLIFWDGNGWSAIPHPQDMFFVESIETLGRFLVAAGPPNDGRRSNNAVQFWDGTCWRRPGQGAGDSIGRGRFPFVYAIDHVQDGLAFCGAFFVAGDQPSGNLAIWRGSEAVLSEAPQTRLAVLPNPSHGPPLLEFTLNQATAPTVEVFDAQGRSVLSEQLGWRAAGTYVARPFGATSSLSSGVYYLRLEAVGEEPQEARWILLR